mmetsp:Transcript_3075/g.11734  ORF Transcript_3075/g.11734 Transcript_3075/m.11734 type:complete len:204 (+) Transcript_3075:933-1544(+)
MQHAHRALRLSIALTPALKMMIWKTTRAKYCRVVSTEMRVALRSERARFARCTPYAKSTSPMSTRKMTKATVQRRMSFDSRWISGFSYSRYPDSTTNHLCGARPEDPRGLWRFVGGSEEEFVAGAIDMTLSPLIIMSENMTRRSRRARPSPHGSGFCAPASGYRCSAHEATTSEDDDLTAFFWRTTAPPGGTPLGWPMVGRRG